MHSLMLTRIEMYLINQFKPVLPYLKCWLGTFNALSYISLQMTLACGDVLSHHIYHVHFLHHWHFVYLFIISFITNIIFTFFSTLKFQFLKWLFYINIPYHVILYSYNSVLNCMYFLIFDIFYYFLFIVFNCHGSVVCL